MLRFYFTPKSAAGWIQESEQTSAGYKLGEFYIRGIGDWGGPYLEVPRDPFDPTKQTPIFFLVPQEDFQSATMIDDIFQGFQKDGIYRYGGAVLLAKTNSKGGQNLLASAPTLDALKKIYDLFRQGELAPEKDWGKKGFLSKIFRIKSDR